MNLGNLENPLAKEIYKARSDASDMVWIGNNGEVTGTLVPRLRKAMQDEENLPGNEELSHLVSLVSRHADADSAAKIDDALADYVAKKRSLRAAVLSGADDHELRQKLAKAADRLERALADAILAIDMALNEVINAKAPSAADFETETAAEIFADIVNENIDSVKKSFSGLIGKGLIANAFRNATKDDVNHKNDGHRKVRMNKL